MSKESVHDAGKAPKFTPLVSFVESSFFTKLSELKLNQFKLDASQQRISGFTTHPTKLNKFNDTPVINLDNDSFSNTEDKSNIRVPGHIVNVNTVEEFKLLDKQALLKEWGKEVQQRILEHGNLDFANFNQFFVLSFSDLKKYKFYYWLAYPVLGAPWVEDDSQSDFTVKDDDIQNHLAKSVNQLVQVDESENLQESLTVPSNKQGKFVFTDTCLSKDQRPGIQLKNYLYYLAYRGFEKCSVFCYRPNGQSFLLHLKLSSPLSKELKITGWERTSQGKLGPKLADLGLLIDPTQLAAQAVDLNLKLMKWRIAPELDLDTIKSQRVLLLGAGTLGSYVARALMGWGVRDITFVDNGRISYSNPVRQPLFSFKDCFSDNGQGETKAPRAAEALKEIFPGVNSKGIAMEVPMIGHAVTDEKLQRESFETLNQLFDEHDVIYLLMDSRESRWLPTLLGYAKNKLVINAALGFDSYLVMRHGNLSQRLGCYYCNDVVAPSDSLTDRTLDQMCTVTRPGVALLASSLAVELMVSVLQHPDKSNAPASTSENSETKFGEVPHQIRGFLHNFQQHKLHAPSFKQCSACSDIVIQQFRELGWDFVKNCLNDTGYLEEICGLKQVQLEADLASAELIKDLEIDDDDEDSEWLS